MNSRPSRPHADTCTCTDRRVQQPTTAQLSGSLASNPRVAARCSHGCVVLLPLRRLGAAVCFASHAVRSRVDCRRLPCAFQLCSAHTSAGHRPWRRLPRLVLPSPDKWTPPILSNSKSRPPPEWDANGDCLFLSPFDALSDKEKALANEIEFDVVSPGNVRLKNHTGEVPSDIKANPILKLLRDGEEKWNRVMKSQSKNLAEAVAKYEDKWGRPPPKGFDQWWLFARARNTLLIDEFDS